MWERAGNVWDVVVGLGGIVAIFVIFMAIMFGGVGLIGLLARLGGVFHAATIGVGLLLLVIGYIAWVTPVLWVGAIMAVAGIVLLLAWASDWMPGPNPSE
jgi:hypothetical protein